MKKNRKILYIAGLCGALAVGVFASPFAQVNTANAVTQNDPLVSQSYVHLAIQQALQSLENGQVQPSRAAVFVPVFVPIGSTILGDYGTEIILRAGIATAHVPTAEGLANITTGADLPHNELIERNHMLIIPRADGRGIRAHSDAWFLVKGDYQIVSIP